jgi:hypothetical protein
MSFLPIPEARASSVAMVGLQMLSLLNLYSLTRYVP